MPTMGEVGLVLVAAVLDLDSLVTRASASLLDLAVYRE